MQDDPKLKSLILTEIKRIAVELGKAPGAATFTQLSGIAQHRWYGVIWPRWSDALAAAGFVGNELQGRFDSEDVLKKVGRAALSLGRIPTTPEMKILRRSDPSFPNPKTVSAHFGNRIELIEALRILSSSEPEFTDITLMLPVKPDVISKVQRVDTLGWVYLLKSGPHYKIGRSDSIERRIKEISVAMPESTVLIHAIQTDDPVGIEAYWHRRFTELRMNGEWFKLGPSELSAFKRRKFQ